MKGIVGFLYFPDGAIDTLAMERRHFSPDAPGTLVPTELIVRSYDPLAEPTRVKTLAFVPDPLPPDVDWNAVKLEHYEAETS